MKIDGTDAAMIAYTQASKSVDQTAKKAGSGNKSEAGTGLDSKSDVIENKNKLQMSDLGKKDLTISEKAFIDEVEKANKAISIPGRRFEYSVHQKTKEIMVKVINTDTDEVVREIPAEKTLDMVAKMWELAGLVVDERR